MNANEILLIGGLPRSGTSLLMQIVAKAGIENFTDGNRVADISNPNGYAEFDGVKGLMKSNAFLKEAIGKSIKVVSPLIPFIDASLKYKCIIMERSIDEVLRSQQVMLGKSVEAIPEALKMAFQKQADNAKQFLTKNNIPFITIQHKELFANPIGQLETIKDFISSEVSVEELSACIDSKLYRQRNEG
ncbi:MAG: LPS sulfotransferase NodH [Parvicella sp.]|jgi:LPS sulfotransferase NodH